jgi:hypothetical protein
MANLRVTVASARIVGSGSNEALTLLYLVPWPSALMCSIQTQVSETFLINATDQISIDVADSSVLHLLKSLSIFSGSHIINICGGHKV